MGKVLIVEDEAMIRTIAQAEFEDAGYAVIEAADGATALRTLQSSSDIGLLFTDIRMPGELDGWGLARAARNLSPKLPVIYATGFSSDALQPVDGALVFTKPYRLSSIIEAAQQLMQNAP